MIDSSDNPSLPEEEQPDQSPAPAHQNLNLAFAFVVTFVLGLSIGFFGRPKLLEDVPIQVVVTVIPPEVDSQAVAQANVSTPPSRSEAEVSAAADPDNQTAGAKSEDVPTPTIMDFVLSDARHFQGDDASPVTIVEFSDFK